MKTVLVLSPNNFIINRVREIFEAKYNFFSATSSENLMEIINSIIPDVAIIDSENGIQKALHAVRTIKKYSSDSQTIGLVNSEKLKFIDEQDLELFDFFSQKPLQSNELRSIVHKAIDIQELKQESRLLKSQMAQLTIDERNNMPSMIQARAGSQYTHVLMCFAKAMSAGFDIDKVTELFLDTVEELVHPSMMVLMIYDKNSETYKIKAHRGFSPTFAENFKLSIDDSLPRWLIDELRIIRKTEVEQKVYDEVFLDIKNILDDLKAAICIPLSARGKLVGILTLGNQVTGIPYENAKLELLFTLASQISVAIKDICLHHQLKYQKNYIENILTGMSSGVITIDETEKITICNQRALSILKKKPHELKNHDLRTLPSPLGDMLFETLNTGKPYEKEEVTVLKKKIPLEVTTSRICNGNEVPIGSAMVFDDISSRKKFIEQRYRSEQLDLINQMTTRVAHEIKNPLVSIQAFLDMFDERFNEQEFRENFGAVAKNDLNRLNRLVEKLISFTQKREYKFELLEVNVLLKECISLVKDRIDKLDISTNLSEETLTIKADREYIKQALEYLLNYLVKTVESNGTLKIRTESSKDNMLLIEMVAEKAKFVEEEIEKLLDPLAVAWDSSIDMGPCVSDRIIQEHEGNIEIEKKGKNLYINVYIPIEQI
ncbi:MAG: histidine kinase dimerization/phospho-acceptor domain-containing protein [Candidatus Heimdallarchaeaceae archaeon]